MNNNLPHKKNIFEGLQLMFYSNTNALAGNGTWIGNGEYSGSYRLQHDTVSEKISDAIDNIKKGIVRSLKPTVLFSFYKLFSSPMPTI